MTSDAIIEKLCRARCAAKDIDPDKIINSAQVEFDKSAKPRYQWELEKREVRCFLAMMRAFEEANDLNFDLIRQGR